MSDSGRRTLLLRGCVPSNRVNRFTMCVLNRAFACTRSLGQAVKVSVACEETPLSPSTIFAEGRGGGVCTQANVSGARSTYCCGIKFQKPDSSQHSPTQPAWQAFKRERNGSFRRERNARDAGYLLPKHQLSVLPRIPAVPIGTSVL